MTALSYLCLVLSCPVLSCPVLSCPVLSCLVFVSKSTLVLFPVQLRFVTKCSMIFFLFVVRRSIERFVSSRTLRVVMTGAASWFELVHIHKGLGSYVHFCPRPCFEHLPMGQACHVFGTGPARWLGSPSPSEAAQGVLSDSNQWRR